MPRFSLSALLALLLAATVLSAGEAIPGGDDWKYDVVHRWKGLPLRGLVVAQGPGYVHIQCISRKPGSPTIVFLEKLSSAEVERVELLPPQERDLLRQRLEALRQERKELADRLKALDPGGQASAPSGDNFSLGRVPWPADHRQQACTYQSTHFRLVSNARPEVVRLAAIQLEQVYAAYVRCLPPRTASAPPTTILLTRSVADYRALVRDRGRNLFNPAFYDPAQNQIVCGSDLDRLGDQLEEARRHHERLAADVTARLPELRAIYRGPVPAELRLPLEEARQKIRDAERRNREGLARAQERLFRRLYHEAFHAYLDNFVYPSRDGQVPRWLNEGLAQIFETAIIEVGELRVGHADPDRLSAVRRALARNALLPLPDLLSSGPKQFLLPVPGARHASSRQVSDRYYLASWALAFYLTFERKLLGTQALDDYVHALHRGTDPAEAFRSLVGQPLTDFERDFLRYLTHLRPDGSTGKGA